MNVIQRSCMVAALALLMPSSSLFAGPSLRARPLPDCRSFWVTNVSYDYRVTKPATVSYQDVAAGYSATTQPSGRHMISWELGIMHNLNPRYAVGLSQCLNWDVSRDLHAGLSVRGRRWLDQEKSVDLTAGVLFWSTEGDRDQFAHPGFVGTASLNFSEWQNVKLTVMAQPIRFDAAAPTQTEFGTFLGYQIGGKPGIIATGAFWVVTGLLALAFAGGI